MKSALDEYVIEGVSHNVPLLHDIMENPTYISGDVALRIDIFTDHLI